jgi:hypothetical protein
METLKILAQCKQKLRDDTYGFKEQEMYEKKHAPAPEAICRV